VASPLDAHLGYWLRFVSNHVSHSFARSLEDQGVTVAEWVVIRQMFELGESAPSLVAESIGMTRGAVSKLIDRLIDKGLVSRESASGDRRYQKVALTDAGVALTPMLAKIADANDSRFFGSLSEERRTLLLDILQELVRTHELKEVPTK
jgi:DNA-binding MarR family transcriptional regulator